MLIPENVVSVTPLLTADGHRLAGRAGNIQFPDGRVGGDDGRLIAAGDMSHVGDAECPGAVPPLQLPPVAHVPLAAVVVQFFSCVTGSLMYRLGPTPPPPIAGLGSITTLRPANRFVPTMPSHDVAGIGRVRDVEHDDRHIGEGDVAADRLDRELIDEEAGHFQLMPPEPTTATVKSGSSENRIEAEPHCVQFGHDGDVRAGVEQELEVAERLAVVLHVHVQKDTRPVPAARWASCGLSVSGSPLRMLSKLKM